MVKLFRVDMINEWIKSVVSFKGILFNWNVVLKKGCSMNIKIFVGDVDQADKLEKTIQTWLSLEGISKSQIKSCTSAANEYRLVITILYGD